MLSLQTIMPFKHKRICPICGKPSLINISSHFLKVHGLKGAERKSYLAKGKYQDITGYDAEPSIPKVKRIAAKGKNRALNSNVKQARTKKTLQVKKSWQSHPYPKFWFKHPFSLMIVGPTSCGKTFFVRQLLESSQMKAFNFEWYYNQQQETYTDFARTVGRHRVT